MRATIIANMARDDIENLLRDAINHAALWPDLALRRCRRLRFSAGDMAEPIQVSTVVTSID